MPKRRRSPKSEQRFTAGQFVSAPYLLDNDVPTDEQMKAKQPLVPYIAQMVEYIPGSKICNIRYLDPEPVPSDEEPPLLNEYPVKHLKEVNGSTFYTHKKKWNELNINEKHSAMTAADLQTARSQVDQDSLPMDTDTKRPRDDDSDDSDAQPKPSKIRKWVQTALTGIWQRPASSNATNVASADPDPVVPAAVHHPVVATKPTAAVHHPVVATKPTAAVHQPTAEVQQPAAELVTPPHSPAQQVVHVHNGSDSASWPQFFRDNVIVCVSVLLWLLFTIGLTLMLRTLWKSSSAACLESFLVTCALLVIVLIPLCNKHYCWTLKVFVIAVGVLVNVIAFLPHMN